MLLGLVGLPAVLRKTCVAALQVKQMKGPLLPAHMQEARCLHLRCPYCCTAMYFIFPHVPERHAFGTGAHVKMLGLHMKKC